MPLTVLLVDDDALDREAVRRAIRAAGLDATLLEAATADGVSELARQGVDCILLDYHLPGTDGSAVLRQLHDDGIDAPVIVLTGHGDEQTAVDLMKAGAADYLSKQALTPDRLERSVRHAVTMAAAERERRDLLIREQTARQDAQTANRVKDEFLATLSHELRTPLNAILGWSRLLAGGELDPPTSRRGFQIIERNVALQVKLIDDLLDISRIITGKLVVEREPVPLVAVMTEAVESERPAAEGAGVTLSCRIVGDERPVVGDSARLQQVVTNLLSNAIKFTPRGGRVDLDLEFVGHEVVLTVRDSGVGIDPEFLPHIFDRFRQGDASTTRQHTGLGLGLAVVKHLVEVQGGRLVAESEGRGRGAVFQVTLPTVDATVAPGGEVDTTRTTLDGISVLLVDDDDDSRETMRVVLELSGADVEAAAGADDALRLAARGPFDVVLSDIAMPGRDGYSLIRALRALWPDTPMMAAAITACATPDDRVQALAAGFRAHLSKPCEPERLVRTVAMLGRTRRAPAGAAPDALGDGLSNQDRRLP